ncbi:hypothetical protein SAMN04487786_0496 [Paenisporosarcina quisquiliarum]|nr:hypothetical protein SAMN04487786_0496 [Paenisporosarcina quisquiliarum]
MQYLSLLITCYEIFEGTPLWGTVNKEINELIGDNDIEEKTDRKDIVGYLCKLITGLEIE